MAACEQVGVGADEPLVVANLYGPVDQGPRQREPTWLSCTGSGRRRSCMGSGAVDSSKAPEPGTRRPHVRLRGAAEI